MTYQRLLIGVDNDIPAVSSTLADTIGGHTICSASFELNEPFHPNQVRRPAVVEVAWLDVDRNYGAIPMLDFDRYEHAFGSVFVCSIAGS